MVDQTYNLNNAAQKIAKDLVAEKTALAALNVDLVNDGKAALDEAGLKHPIKSALRPHFKGFDAAKVVLTEAEVDGITKEYIDKVNAAAVGKRVEAATKAIDDQAVGIVARIASELAPEKDNVEGIANILAEAKRHMQVGKVEKDRAAEVIEAIEDAVSGLEYTGTEPLVMTKGDVQGQVDKINAFIDKFEKDEKESMKDQLSLNAGIVKGLKIKGAKEGEVVDLPEANVAKFTKSIGDALKATGIVDKDISAEDLEKEAKSIYDNAKSGGKSKGMAFMSVKGVGTSVGAVVLLGVAWNRAKALFSGTKEQTQEQIDAGEEPEQKSFFSKVLNGLAVVASALVGVSLIMDVATKDKGFGDTAQGAWAKFVTNRGATPSGIAK